MNNTIANPLPLSNLTIEGFRGLSKLTAPRLGRVTLLAGKNGVGKTTVLEAIKIWAARGTSESITNILSIREEFGVNSDRNSEIAGGLTIEPLFHGRNPSPGSQIKIGPNDENGLSTLSIEFLNGNANLPDEVEKAWRDWQLTGAHLTLTTFAGSKSNTIWGPSDVFRRRRFSSSDREFIDDYYGPPRFLAKNIRSAESRPADVSTVVCSSLGPGLLAAPTLKEYWESITLTDDEDKAIDALNIVIKENIIRLAIIENRESRNHLGSQVIAKIRDKNLRVPLKSLGDGAMRLFSIALALFQSKNGFLLIDEVENGLHHTVHESLWDMVLRTAHENQIQVVATTHSFDCIKGFARAAIKNVEADGVLFRIENESSTARAVRFGEDELEVVVNDGVEVR